MRETKGRILPSGVNTREVRERERRGGRRVCGWGSQCAWVGGGG